MAQEPFDWGGVNEDGGGESPLVAPRPRLAWNGIPPSNTCLVVAMWVILLTIIGVAATQMWAHTYRVAGGGVPLTVAEWALLLWHPLDGNVADFPDGNSPLIIANHVRVAGTVVIDLCALVMMFACLRFGSAPVGGCRIWCGGAALFLFLGVSLGSLLSPIVWGATELPTVGEYLLNQRGNSRNEYVADLIEVILFISALLVTLSAGCYMHAIRKVADEFKMPAVGSSARKFFWTFATLHLIILVLAWGTCSLIYWLYPGFRPQETLRPGATKVWFGVWCLFAIITMFGCTLQCIDVNGMIRGDLKKDKS